MVILGKMQDELNIEKNLEKNILKKVAKLKRLLVRATRGPPKNVPLFQFEFLDASAYLEPGVLETKF